MSNTTSRFGWARLWSALTIGCLALVACVPPGPWPHVVDQQHTGVSQTMSARIDAYNCNGTLWDLEVAQTFVASWSGLLDQVSLVAVPAAAAGALTIGIHPIGVDGRPLATSLGGGSFSGPGSPDTHTLIHVRLANPATVVAGHGYAIVASTPVVSDCPSGTIYGWNLFGAGDGYPSGQVWQRGSISSWTAWTWPDGWANDLYFQTWVRPGPP